MDAKEIQEKIDILQKEVSTVIKGKGAAGYDDRRCKAGQILCEKYAGK